MHPDTRLEFLGEELGHGVVATAPIPRGTITWIQDPLDQVFTADDVLDLPPASQELLEYWAFRNAHGEMVLCWDHGRYVNHSFRSNCLSTAYDFEIAVRDIAPGEQITDDYGYLNLSTPWRPLDEGTRRKWVRPDDVVRYARVWDRRLHEAVRRFHRVPQKLDAWLPERTRAEIDRVRRGEATMRSIRELHWAAHTEEMNHGKP